MPESTIVKMEYEAGYLITTDDGGRKSKTALSEVVTASDVPDLNITSMTLLTTLAQVVMVLVKDLVEKNIVQEELVSGYDLEYVLETLVDTLGAEEV